MSFRSIPSFDPTINPVDLTRSITLPEPWAQLAEHGFRPGGVHEDLFFRAKGAALYYTDRGHQKEVNIWLQYLGNGYLEPFSAETFPALFAIENDDPDAQLKRGALNALAELAGQFGRRVPSIVWASIGFLTTRANPRQRQTILSQKDRLPLPYWIVDGVLHAFPIVYGFKDHVNSVLFRHTGMVLDHNCDCDCDIHPPEDGGTIKCDLPNARWKEATMALASHLSVQVPTIMIQGLPFNFGLSPEAAEVMALRPAA